MDLLGEGSICVMLFQLCVFTEIIQRCRWTAGGVRKLIVDLLPIRSRIWSTDSDKNENLKGRKDIEVRSRPVRASLSTTWPKRSRDSPRTKCEAAIRSGRAKSAKEKGSGLVEKGDDGDSSEYQLDRSRKRGKLLVM
jgi:hypothetical protein